MRDYRVELVSTDPEGDLRFAVCRNGINEHEAIMTANKEYNPFGFEVDRERVTEIMR